MSDETQAIMPIIEALPELRADDYSDVREWDDCRMRLEAGYERADGEYLFRIQGKLKPARLWLAYLQARGLPERTAYDRIAKYEGRYIAPRRVADSATSPVAMLPSPSHQPAPWSDPPDPIDDADEDDWRSKPEPSPVILPPRAPLSTALFTSETPEWYTPPDLMAEIARFLHGIDMDPCPAPQEGVARPDGLSIPWVGKVFCNPPYGRTIGDWIEKAINEPGMQECVLLVPARTDAEWFQPLWDWMLCFIKGRLKFSGSETSAPFPSVLAYAGNRVDQFGYAFAHRGVTVGRYDWAGGDYEEEAGA